jgi:cytochrome b
MVASAPTRRVRVWDLPTRLFHWSLALLMIGSVATVKAGDLMHWHARCGYAILALLAFRLAWGLVGPHHARFANFVRGPGAVLSELRGRLPDAPGHSPLAALSVVAMLAALAFQAVSGLFADDEIAFQGPLALTVTAELSGALTTWHRRNEWALLALIGLHVAAVVYWRFVRGHDLLRPMLGGDAWAAPDAQASRDDTATRLRALVIAAACGAGVAWLVRG